MQATRRWAKYANISEPRFPRLENRDNNNTNFSRLWKLNEIICEFRVLWGASHFRKSSSPNSWACCQPSWGDCLSYRNLLWPRSRVLPGAACVNDWLMWGYNGLAPWCPVRQLEDHPSSRASYGAGWPSAQPCFLPLSSLGVSQEIPPPSRTSCTQIGFPSKKKMWCYVKCSEKCLADR